jgi:MFS family permease
LAGPLSAALIARVGLRRTMMLGVVLSGLGYAGLASAPSFALVLAAYLLIGVGIALFGSMPASVLANNWFQPRPGRAIGFVNMPLLVALLPVAGQLVIDQGGLRTLYVALAALHLLLIPVAWGLIERPAGPVAAPEPIEAVEGAITTRFLVRQPAFWALVIGAGLLNAIGITAVSHNVPLVREIGAAPVTASLIAALAGVASMAGSLLVGFICDRLGAARTLSLVAATFAVSWLVLGASNWSPFIALPVLAIGLCGASVFPCVNVLASHLYGLDALPRVLGLFGLLTLPLTFCLPPLAGELHDVVGGYSPVTLVVAGIAAAVAVLFHIMVRAAARRLRLRGGSEALV